MVLWGLRGNVAPKGHKQRYIAQGIPKSNAEIAEKPRFLG